MSNKKPPVILFTTGMFPPALGGPGTVLTNLIPRLVEEKYNCMVLTFGRDDGVYRSYPVTRASLSVPQPLRGMLVFLQVFRASLKADLIYTLDTYTHGLSSLIVSKILRKPLILRFTGDSAWETLFNQGKIKYDIISFQKKWCGIKAAFRKFLRTQILKGADRIITDCKFLRGLVKVIGIDTGKVVVINNAVQILPELNKFNPYAFRNQLGLRGKVIMTMTRLVPWKGVEVLIKMMPHIITRFPDTTLLIVGDGPQEIVLKELTNKLGIKNSVLFLGKIIDKEEKKRLYTITDVFVLNTFYEGMSNTLLEAMAEQKSIITTSSGGNPEFMNRTNGILVEYNNQEEITKSIIKLLSDSELALQFGHRAQKTAYQYTWDNLVQKNIALMNSLL